jgi:AraC-type DNA-binding domain-containing proteins
LKYIEDNYNKKITLKEMASYNFYNPSYFSSIFKECFGKTPLEYITEIRMERAIRMMRDSGLSIEEICHSIGYSNKKHFYKVFKNMTGMTPHHFRKANHSGDNMAASKR